jgi:clan AA aspartic protease
MRMDGYFNATGEPVINLTVDSIEIEVLVDTGFDGDLIIPEEMAKELVIEYDRGLKEFLSATGKPFLVSTGSMEISWLGTRTRMPVSISSEINEALLGGHMLRVAA